MISVVTVNWKSEEFLKILSESLALYSTTPYELIVIDNNQNNVGHGEGLNRGCREAAGEYTLFLDSDCHVLSNGWDELFLGLVREFDVVGGRGVPQKPIRPACLFLKTALARSLDWRPTPGYQGHRVTPEGYDVAIKAYHQMVAHQIPIKLLDAVPSRYHTLNGEEFQIDGVSVVYHHWHGSHLLDRSVDFPDRDLFADRDNLFLQIPWRQFQLF